MKKAMLAVLILILINVSVAGCGKSAAQESSETFATSTETTTQQSTESEQDSDTPTESNDPEKIIPTADGVVGHFFQYKDTIVGMGQKAEPILASLGEALDMFEAPSCAFDGIDRIYYYNGFELFTYPVNNVDHVLSINLTDDSVQTSEGLYLGMTIEELESKYGEPASLEDGLYKYTKDGTSLSFITEDDTIVSITYSFIVE